MTLENIKEFIVLYEFGNYMTASEHLFTSQATLSRHILALEEEIGAPLFQRTPRRVELTATGQLFLPYARRMLDYQTDALRTLKRAQTQTGDVLTIGILRTNHTYGMVEVLARFMKNHPTIRIQLVSGTSAELQRKVLAGECAFALVFEAEQHSSPELVHKRHAQDQLLLVVSATHPLANRKRIDLASIREEPILLFPPEDELHAIALQTCHQAGFEPKELYSGVSFGRKSLELVGLGLCNAMIPRHAACLLNSPNYVLLEFNGSPILHYDLIYRREADMPTPKKLFLQEYQRSLRSMAGGDKEGE